MKNRENNFIEARSVDDELWDSNEYMVENLINEEDRELEVFESRSNREDYDSLREDNVQTVNTVEEEPPVSFPSNCVNDFTYGKVWVDGTSPVDFLKAVGNCTVMNDFMPESSAINESRVIDVPTDESPAMDNLTDASENAEAANKVGPAGQFFAALENFFSRQDYTEVHQTIAPPPIVQEVEEVEPETKRMQAKALNSSPTRRDDQTNKLIQEGRGTSDIVWAFASHSKFPHPVIAPTSLL